MQFLGISGIAQPWFLGQPETRELIDEPFSGERKKIIVTPGTKPIDTLMVNGLQHSNAGGTNGVFFARK
jgi:hypothetical protein